MEAPKTQGGWNLAGLRPPIACLTNVQFAEENRSDRAEDANGAGEMARRRAGKGVALHPVVVVVVDVDRLDEELRWPARKHWVSQDRDRRTRQREVGVGKDTIIDVVLVPYHKLVAASTRDLRPAQAKRVPRTEE